MKNYYEILQVDKEASFEVIDKAYKVLAKKYHPDRNPEEKKEWAEENFKKINEAYETLSDNTKRKAYNQELASSTIDYSKKYEELYKQQEILKQELQILRNRLHSSTSSRSDSSINQAPYDISPQDTQQSSRMDHHAQPDFNDMRKQEFDRAYHSIFNSLGYSIRQKRTFKDFLALIITIFLLAFIGFVLWQIPFTKNYLISFYENNTIIKGLVDLFLH